MTGIINLLKQIADQKLPNIRYEQQNALPESSGRALLSRTASVIFYSQVKFATIRRFFALPALVLLLATGLDSP